MRHTRLAAFALCSLAGATLAVAQPRQPPADWPPSLSPGSAVWVVVDERDPTGISGRIADVSDKELRLQRGREVQTIARADIRRIERHDALVNGGVVGALVGAAALGASYALLSEAICSGCGNETASTLQWTALGAGIGGVAGLSIDALHAGRRVVYVSPVLGSSPRRSARRAGATLTIAW